MSPPKEFHRRKLPRTDLENPEQYEDEEAIKQHQEAIVKLAQELPVHDYSPTLAR